ncbi:MAG: CD225/dispanin family protein [Verrucomicrobiota bacterium]
MYKLIGADQKEYGPISPEQLREWIAQRRADAKTLALREGETSWRPLSSFPEFADILAQASAPTPPGLRPERPPTDYLVPAVLGTLCCCPPLGLVAMYYAVQCRTQSYYNDHQRARESARLAKIWFWVSLLLGIPFMILMTVLRFASMADQMPQ